VAKKAVIAREVRRAKLVDTKRAKRDSLRKTVKCTTADFADRITAMFDLQKMKRDSNPSRRRNRCQLCGRPRGTLRKFGLCRICLRQALMRGDVPGGRKASW